MTDKSSLVGVDRRKLFQAAGVGLVASLGMSQAFAEDFDYGSESDKVKEEFVNNFCRAWSSLDVETLTPYLADTIEYHIWEGGTIIKGIEQFREHMTDFMANMKEINWDILRSTAMGDIVMNERIDHFIRGENSAVPNNHFDVVGIFVVRQGKIQYWKDYGYKDTA